MRPEREGPRHLGGGGGGAGSSGATLSSAAQDRTLGLAASSYAARGWPVFPLRPGAKEPLTPHGFKDATTDPEAIAEWWRRWPEANIAIVTGTLSGVAVLDIDPRNGGDESLRDLEARYGPLPDTPTVLTGGGGQHFFLAIPPGVTVRSRRVAPGVDLKGEGGFVVAPPSVHPSGRRYVWELGRSPDDLPLAPLPAWLLEVGDDGQREWRWDGEPVPEGRRHNHLNSLAGRLRADGLCVEAIEAALLRENERRCSPPLPVAEVKRIARSMDNYPPYPNFPGNGSRADAPPAAALERQAEDTFTDAANARALAALLEDKALFVEGWGWCVWQGDRWVRDPQGAITLRLAREHLPRYYLLEALATPSQERRVEMTERAIKVQARARLEAALHLARGDLYARADDFDADPWALNTPGGIIDLRTGQIRRRTPRDRVTRLTGASPPQDGRPWHEHAPTWAAFLKRVLPDPEVRAFVQRAAGYCLTGDVSEQVLFFLHGPGGNGKTTFIRALQAALGDYASQAAPELLLTKLGERHPTEIADLKGARLVATIEVEEGRRLAESLVKWLTGGDKLKARFMRQDFFEFEPTAKFWLVANHKPVVRGSDYAIWRRILLVPFGVTMPEGERDPRLLEKLRAELGGILLWALEGLQEWQAKGLAPPPAVRRATDEYRREMDLLGDWLDERTITDPAALTPFKALYEDYVEWCRAAGKLALGQRSFGNRLNERGFAPATMADGKTRARRGLRLRDNDPPPSARPAECAQHRGLTGGESHLPGVNPTTSSAQSGKSGKAHANKLAAGARRQAFEEEGAGGLLGAEKGGEEAGAGPIIKEGAAPPPEGPPHPPQPCPRCQPAGVPGYYTCERGEEVTLLRVGIDRGQHVLRSRQAICFNSGLLRAVEPDFLVVSFTDGSWGWATLATARKLGHEGEFGAERQLAVPLGVFTWEAAQGEFPDTGRVSGQEFPNTGFPNREFPNTEFPNRRGEFPNSLPDFPNTQGELPNTRVEFPNTRA